MIHLFVESIQVRVAVTYDILSILNMSSGAFIWFYTPFDIHICNNIPKVITANHFKTTNFLGKPKI